MLAQLMVACKYGTENLVKKAKNFIKIQQFILYGVAKN